MEVQVIIRTPQSSWCISGLWAMQQFETKFWPYCQLIDSERIQLKGALKSRCGLFEAPTPGPGGLRSPHFLQPRNRATLRFNMIQYTGGTSLQRTSSASELANRRHRELAFERSFAQKLSCFGYFNESPFLTRNIRKPKKQRQLSILESALKVSRPRHPGSQ
jgi:hypothetical protein